MDLFEKLGFRWDRCTANIKAPSHSIERAASRFNKMMPEFVWDAAVLEGNPLTYQDVQVVLSGLSVGGRKISDQEQIINFAAASKKLLSLIKSGKFDVSKKTFTDLHKIVARNEALEWGCFRGEGEEVGYTPNVGLGVHGVYTPLATLRGAPELNKVFTAGISEIERGIKNPLEKALIVFLFGALQQFFFDGNKRTSRFMMNGILMSNGMDAISIPAEKAQEFNEKMVNFYLKKDATEMLWFLSECHPDIEKKEEKTSAKTKQIKNKYVS
jgi:Fic family protein